MENNSFFVAKKLRKPRSIHPSSLKLKKWGEFRPHTSFPYLLLIPVLDNFLSWKNGFCSSLPVHIACGYISQAMFIMSTYTSTNYPGRVIHVTFWQSKKMRSGKSERVKDFFEDDGVKRRDRCGHAIENGYAILLD